MHRCSRGSGDEADMKRNNKLNLNLYKLQYKEVFGHLVVYKQKRKKNCQSHNTQTLITNQYLHLLCTVEPQVNKIKIQVGQEKSY